MKRIILIALAIVCGVACTDCFAKKPKKRSLKDEEMQATIERWRRERDSLYISSRPQLVYIDTVRIDSICEVPIFIDREHRMIMPEIYYNNPIHYMKFAFGDTDKDKFYCAYGRGEADTYGEAKRMALVEAVTKIYNAVGDSVKLGHAELLMTEEDRFDDDFVEHLENAARERGDSATLASLQARKEKRIIEVAIRISKNKTEDAEKPQVSRQNYKSHR